MNYFPNSIKKVAVIAPAGRVDQEKLAIGLAFLEGQGLEYVVGQSCYSEFRYLAGSDDLRAEELESFWCRNDIDAVLCARGGYGTMRLFGRLDWEKMARFSNVLVGHSDITALHCAFASQGLSSSISGVMVAAEMSRENDKMTAKTLYKSFSDDVGYDFFEGQVCDVLKPGNVKGMVYPVTLSVLSYLLHTDYLPDFRGAILVIEDVNEAAYKLDCFLTQLESAGILAELGGLIYGNFSGDLDEDDLLAVEEEFAMKINGPVCRLRSFGHCLPRLNLPFGQAMKLTLSDDLGEMSMTLCGNELDNYLS